MIPALTYLCGMAATVFISVGLSVAAVRWYHMCHPFDKEPGYYYPGRPYVVAVYLNALLLLPYALNPASADAWFMARLYFLPVTIYHFTVLLFSYFGSVMQWRKWRGPMLVIGIPVLLALLAAFVLAIWPGDQVGSTVPALSKTVLYVLGIIMTVVCGVSMWVVHTWAKAFNVDDYSNPSDFPVVAARRWIVLVIANVALCWLGALSASRCLLAVVMLLFAVSSIIFIISALHPQRSGSVHAAPANGRAVSRNRRLDILSAISVVVVEQEAFLDPHLTIQDVADRCGYGRSTLSGLFKAEFGGFFNYINDLRLKHVESYLKENPSATLQEAATESGFSSRQAYYKVKAKLRN